MRGITDEEMVAAALDPRHTWPAPEDRQARMHVRGACAVILAPDQDEPLILYVSTAEWAYEQQAHSARRAAAERRVGKRLSRGPQSVSDFLDACAAQGIVNEIRGSGHYRLTHPDHKGAVVLPSTPSDPRSLLNAISNIRSTFGIDLRHDVQRPMPVSPEQRK